ncbi:MAG: hypothetical protein ACLGHV_13545, partial [Gammaproteobacteria bacterium]
LGLPPTKDWTAALEADWANRLRALDQLTMGDFATIRRQCDILQERLAPEAWLDQLEAEHRLKPEVREQRPLGFLA